MGYFEIVYALKAEENTMPLMISAVYPMKYALVWCGNIIVHNNNDGGHGSGALQ